MAVVAGAGRVLMASPGVKVGLLGYLLMLALWGWVRLLLSFTNCISVLDLTRDYPEFLPGLQQRDT